MRWVSTADFNECLLEGQADIDLSWGGPFQGGDGACHRRAAMSVQNLRLDPTQEECATSLELGTELDSLMAVDAADPGACFPGNGTIEFPVVLDTRRGKLRTQDPLSLKSPLDSPSVSGITFSKAAPLVALVDSAMPEAGPAGFILRFDLRFLSCDCFPAAPLHPRMALLDGTARVKLYGPSKEAVLDLSGRAVVDRSGGAPHRDDRGLQCTENVRIDGLTLQGMDQVVGAVRVKWNGPLEGNLSAPVEGCELAPPFLHGVLEVEFAGFHSEVTAGLVDLSWIGGATVAQGPSILRSAVALPLYRIGDPEKRPVGECREIELRLEIVEVPRCLPVEERMSFPVQLDLDVKLGAEPAKLVHLTGNLAVVRAPLSVGASQSLRFAIENLDVAADDPILGGMQCKRLLEEPALFDLSIVDSGACSPQSGRIGFVPEIHIGALVLRGQSPIEFEGTLDLLGSPGSRLTADREVPLIDGENPDPVGSIARGSLRWLSPLRGRAEDLPRSLVNGSLTRIDLPIDFNVALADLEVEIDLLHTRLNAIEILLLSPAGRSVLLLQRGTLQELDLASRLRARFSRRGRRLAPPLGRGDLLEPADPAAFSDLAAQRSGGTWAVEIRETGVFDPPATGVLAELRLNFSRKGSLPENEPLLEDLSLTSAFCTSFLRWDRSPPQPEFRFIRDGRWMPGIIGPDQFSVLDSSPQTSAGLVQYAAVDPARSSLLGLIEARVLNVPSVEAVRVIDEDGTLKLTWSSPVNYQAIRLTLDGEPLATLPGSATSHQVPDSLARGKLVGVGGIRCGIESEPRYPPLAPESPLDGVSCRLDSTVPELTLEGIGPYKSLRIYRDGSLVAEIPGHLRSFADRGFTPRPGQGILYCVQPVYESASLADQVCCSLSLPPPLLPQCSVLSSRRTVRIDVLGEIEFFDWVVIVRDDLVPFVVTDRSVLDETPPETLETSLGVTYYLTSQFQGVVYPYTSCYVVRPLDRGDCNSDSRIDLTDALTVLSALFLDGKPSCQSACDTNGDEGLDLTDALFLLQYLFLQGGPPPPTASTCSLSIPR